MDASGHHKRTLDDDKHGDLSCVSSRNENISPRLLDAQVGLTTSVGCHGDTAGAGSDRGRITGAVKCRRLGLDLSGSSSPFNTKLKVLPSPVPPALQFVGDQDGIVRGQGRPIFTLNDAQFQRTPTISTSLTLSGCASELKNCLPAHAKRQNEVTVARSDGPGVSPAGSQEEHKNSGLQSNVNAAGRGLTISHRLGSIGQANSGNPVFGALAAPFRKPITVFTTTPLSKQDVVRDPFLIAQHQSLEIQNVNSQNVESVKGTSTPLQDSDGLRNNLSNASMPSFDVDDVSSDEELIGIPGPDIPDPDISYSQEKLGDLSVAENSLEEKVVLKLCDGLANSLTQVERDRMELLNLYTIELAHLATPLVLGRDQFQNVFGDSIRGGMLSHLSRRHCLIHVENMSRNDDTKVGVKVRVEDTSTNGIRVNGVLIKHGQVYDLELNDIITLLRIRRDEDDISLGYKLVRCDSPLENSKRTRRVSRHDGRFVRPGDKFSCDSLDVSNHQNLTPAHESNVASINALPMQAIAQEIRHQIPMGPDTPAESRSLPEKEEKMRKLYQNDQSTRRIRCTILFADKVAQDFSDSSQPSEEANFDYREELSEILSAFASIRTFDASSYNCASSETFGDALSDDSDVIIYTGGGDKDHLVIEGPDGLAVRFESNDILQLFNEATCITQKLIIVIASTLEPAKLLAECGAVHVCYLSSISKHSLRVTAFIRAFFAGLLKGFTIEKSYALAEFVALNDLLPIVQHTDQFCSLLPSLNRHNIKVGSPLAEGVVSDKNTIALLNAPFIPVLATHFLGRDVQVRQIKAALAQKVRVCNLYGSRGIGKSSIAIHIAKVSYRTRGYRNGVHYFAVDKLVEEFQSGIKSVVAHSDVGDCLQTNNQLDHPLPKIIEGVESLLRMLPGTDPANYPTTLLVLDGCDTVLPALEVFVMNLLRSFPGVQILLTSTEKLQLDSAEGEVLPVEVTHVEELGKVDSARLFFKLARGHLTSKQFRHHFPDSSIEAISNDERVLGTKGNPFHISRLVYDLKSQTIVGGNEKNVLT